MPKFIIQEMVTYEVEAETAQAALDWKFRDMPEGVRNRWVSWCFTHDWCVSAGQNGCREFFVEDQEGNTHKFETPRELRNWAGY